MPKKSLPIMQKVSNLLKISIVVAKMGKPIITKLILLKKSRKLKRFKLLKHYNNHRFIEEYQFSASSTPLIRYHRKQLKNTSLRDIYSMFFLCRCFSGLKPEGVEAACYSEIGTLPTVTREFVEPLAHLEDEEDSVDERAERFIEWFHQEMRMQRQDSF